eukprot:TRINITY_DN28749_c0_g1_i1.p1 TRINITY_DN28749_c0_g1~~TRINITY_DN28749_c0_g1_i1.p1  ORF type:complete len:194 (-),score=17.97 TRINITY_DN28749_c0_g1_i1:188-769(-)
MVEHQERKASRNQRQQNNMVCEAQDQIELALQHARELNRQLRNHTFELDQGQLKNKYQLTFTAPPDVSRAKLLPKVDYTFNDDRLGEIKQENNHLLLKLVEINNRSLPQNQSKGKGVKQNGSRSLPCAVAPASLNRKLHSKRIVSENMALYQRLQAVKPTNYLSRKQMDKHCQLQQKYQKICTKFHPKQEFMG